MTLRESIIEEGTILVDNHEIPISRVVTDKKNVFVDTPQGLILIDFIELDSRKAFLKTPNGEWIKGRTHHRRWSGGDGYPERQTIFNTDRKEWNEIVIRSTRITV